MEIRCPADCGYLSASRAHPPAVVQRQQQRDFSAILPLLQGLTEPQSRLLLLLSRCIARHTPQDLQSLCDQDIAAAAGAIAATLETAGRGVIYEHHAGTRPARDLADELKAMLAEVGRAPQTLSAPAADDRKAGETGFAEPQPVNRARLDRDAAAALRRIEQGAHPGPAAGATAYRDLLGRLFGDTAAADTDGAAPSQPRLIVP